MSKKWLLVLPLIVVFLLLFQNWIVFKAVEGFLQTTLEESFSGKMAWDSVEHQGSTLVLHGPKVVSGGEISFAAERLALHWRLKPFERTILVDAELVRPEGRLSRRQMDLFAQLSEKSLYSFIKRRGTLKIQEGKVDLPGGPALVDLDLEYQEEKRVKLSLKQGEAFLELGGTSQGESFEAKAEAHRFPLFILSDFIDTMAPSLLEGRILKGVLDGHLALRLSPQVRPQVEAKLVLYDFVMNGMRKGYGFEIGHLSMDLQPSSTTERDEIYPWLPSIEGDIVLAPGGKIEWEKFGKRPLIASGLSGFLHFNKENEAFIELQGIEEYEGEKGTLIARGHWNYQHSDKMAGSLSYLSEATKRPSTSLELRGIDIGAPTSHLQLDIKNFGLQQFSLVEAFLHKLAPGMNPMDFREGRVDAALKATLTHQKLAHISIENLSLRNLSCRAREWECTFGAEALSGFLHVNLAAENPSETLNTELQIVNGKLNLETPPEDLWKFSEIQTRLIVNKGVVQKSSASVNLAGLKGIAEIDWQSTSQPLKMHFEGKGGDLARFMPPHVRSGIEKNSLSDEIFLDLAMKKENKAMRFNGEAKIKEAQPSLSYDFAFGFDLKAPEKGWTSSDETFSFWSEVAPAWLPDIMGPYGLGAAQTLLSKMEREVGIFGFRLTDGWIAATNMPLEKFVSPYLFPRDDLHISGRADFRARFDLKGLSLAYTAQNITLESERIKMTLKEVPGRVRGELLGDHYVDFMTGNFRGKLPLDQATYFEKEKGILFTNIHGEAIFDGKKVFLPDVALSSNDLDLQGDVIVDNTDEREGYFDVYLNAYLMEGNLSAAHQLLEKIDSSLPLLSLPLEGQVYLRDEGMNFVFHVTPDYFTWDGKVVGSLSEGSLDLAGSLLTSKEMHLNFEFNKAQDRLLLTDFSGSLFLGEGPLEHYHFFIDKIGFNPLSAKEGVFDIQIFDPKREILKMVGTTRGEGEYLHFHFDEACHFGGVHPDSIDLTMKGLSQVEHFHLDLSFDLKQIVEEFKRIASSDFFLSPKLSNRLENLTGQLDSHLYYDQDLQRFLFDLKGQKVQIKDHPLEKVYLSGDYREGIWRVKEATIDDLSFSLNATKKKGNWLLEHFGLKVGDSLIVGLEGEWEEGSATFLSRVNLLEIELEKLGEFEELKPFVEEFLPKGHLKGSGTLSLAKKEGNEWGVEAALTTRFKNLELKGLLFQDLEPSTLQFATGQGLQFRHLKTALLYPDNKIPLVDLFIEKIEIDFNQDEAEVGNLRYRLPAVNLPWLANILEEVFPEYITPFVKETLSTLKSEGLASGSLDLKHQKGNSHFKASFDDGLWHLMGWEGDLKNFTLEVDQEEIKLASQYVLDSQLLWIVARTPLPDPSRGVVVISDGMTEAMPITVYWENHSGSGLGPGLEPGLVIKEIKGQALGLSVSLIQDPDNPTTADWLRLKGSLSMDLSKASSFLAPELREKVRALELGQGWNLQGHFQLEKGTYSDERVYHFTGDLHGHFCELKGLCFEHLFAKVEASQDHVRLTHFQLHDPAASFVMNQADFDRQPSGQWIAKIPRIEGKDIRPSQFWEVGKSRPHEIKPLQIRSLVIQDINGPLNPLAGLKGTGYLTFVNPVKKNLHNTIFALPAEIISRIGVDLIALTPVSGTLQFHLQNEMVVFTKFKDIYSDGKLSKFYLAASRTPSYMDFDGTLHLQVKMKQYTLLFKLAELFTISIEGPLSKPIYSLKKGGGS